MVFNVYMALACLICGAFCFSALVVESFYFNEFIADEFILGFALLVLDYILIEVVLLLMSQSYWFLSPLI